MSLPFILQSLFTTCCGGDETHQFQAAPYGMFPIIEYQVLKVLQTILTPETPLYLSIQLGSDRPSDFFQQVWLFYIGAGTQELGFLNAC